MSESRVLPSYAKKPVFLAASGVCGCQIARRGATGP
jgi:hypothetical protein